MGRIVGTIYLKKSDRTSVHVYSASDNSWRLQHESGFSCHRFVGGSTASGMLPGQSVWVTTSNVGAQAWLIARQHAKRRLGAKLLNTRPVELAARPSMLPKRIVPGASRRLPLGKVTSSVEYTSWKRFSDGSSRYDPFNLE